MFILIIVTDSNSESKIYNNVKITSSKQKFHNKIIFLNVNLIIINKYKRKLTKFILHLIEKLIAVDHDRLAVIYMNALNLLM